MPGAPPRSAASIPESSAITTSPVASRAARALISALASKLSPVSGGRTTSSGSGRRSTPGNNSAISFTLWGLRVERINAVSQSGGDPLLHLPQAADPVLGQAQQL